MILNQSAFRAAPLAASLPGLTVAEPLAGIALGAALFADPLKVTPAALVAELLCLVIVVIGVRLLSLSPLIDAEQLVEAQDRATEEADALERAA